MAPTDITFHPAWWHERGFSFDETFFLDCETRMRIDREMRRTLFDEFGSYGLGERDPVIRPLIDSDLLAGEFVQALLIGCDVQFDKAALPFVHSLNMTDTQLHEFKPAELAENPYWKPYAKQYEQLFNRFSRVESYMDMHGVQNLALSIRGQTLFEDYYMDADTARKTLEIAYKTICAVAGEVRKYTPSTSIGVTSIIRQIDPDLYVTSDCSCDLISLETYETFLFEYDSKLSRQFMPFGIHHCGGNMQRLAPAYARLAPAFIEIGAFSDISNTLKHFDIATAVNLRYSPRDLATKTPEEIRHETVRMKQEAAVFERVSLSCVGIDADAPKANITAFLEAAQYDAPFVTAAAIF